MNADKKAENAVLEALASTRGNAAITIEGGRCAVKPYYDHKGIRRAIGIEIEERYCEIAAKRLSQEVLT